MQEARGGGRAWEELNVYGRGNPARHWARCLFGFTGTAICIYFAGGSLASIFAGHDGCSQDSRTCRCGHVWAALVASMLTSC